MPKITCSTEDVIKKHCRCEFTCVPLIKKPSHVHSHLTDKKTVPTFPAKGELNSASCEWQMRQWQRGVWPFSGGSASHRSGCMCRRCGALTWLYLCALTACLWGSDAAQWHRKELKLGLKKQQQQQQRARHSFTNTTANRTVSTHHQETWCYLWSSSSSSVCLRGARDDETPLMRHCGPHLSASPGSRVCVEGVEEKGLFHVRWKPWCCKNGHLLLVFSFTVSSHTTLPLFVFPVQPPLPPRRAGHAQSLPPPCESTELLGH